jgi:hypothetical protein
MGTPTISEAEDDLVGVFGRRRERADGPGQALGRGSGETDDLAEG